MRRKDYEPELSFFNMPLIQQELNVALNSGPDPVLSTLQISTHKIIIKIL